jgi:hypothetical protein
MLGQNSPAEADKCWIRGDRGIDATESTDTSMQPGGHQRPVMIANAPGRNNHSASETAGIYYAEEMTTGRDTKAKRKAKPRRTTAPERRRPVQYRLPQEWIGASGDQAPPHVRRIIIQGAEAGTGAEQ